MNRFLLQSNPLFVKRVQFLFTLLILAVITAQPYLKGFDDFVKQTIHSFDVPGIAVGIVKNDSLIYAKGFGVRKLGDKAPVDANTLFAIGSISKSTVAIALGILVDEGKIKWDDPVTKYLPDFQMDDPWVSREITIRDLLTHRSGLISESGGTIWYGSDYSRADVIRRLRYLKPVTSFRYKYAYQNVMYLVAGEIIPAVTGQSWDDFIQERLFKPLGMSTSNTHLKDLDKYTNVSIPHAFVNGRQQPIAYRNYDNVGPACSVNSTVVEMAQYVRLLLNGGVYKGRRLYSPAVAFELFNPQMIVPIRDYGPGLELLKPKFFAYGFGWFLKEYRGRKLVYHTGGLDGIRAMVMMVPDEKLGIIVLTNQEDSRVYNVLTYYLLDSYLVGKPYDWLGAYLKDRATALQNSADQERRIQAERVSNTKPSLELSQYTGKYTDRMYGEIDVIFENNHLILKFSHTPSFTGDLEHWHYNTFRIKWRDPVVPDGFLTFQMNAKGQVGRIDFNQPNLLDVDFSELEINQAQ